MRGLLLGLGLVLTAHAAPPPAPPADTELQALLARVDPQRLQQRIATLAAFGTRHTASDTQSATRGIGAARRWIEAELRACAQDTALRVETRKHLEPPGRRVAAPTELVNVLAILPGRAGSARQLLMLGHYDSRNGDVMDAAGEAPGANDDASGTAAVMEAACLAAQTAKQRPFDATLVFAAVAGEEQGLLGSGQLAKEFDDQGVEAVITNDIVGSPRGADDEHAPQRLRLFADGLDPLLRLLLRGPNTPVHPRLQAQQALAANGGADELPAAQLGRHLQRAAEHYLPGFEVQLIQRRDRTLRGGDHLPFLERGQAAVRFSEPFENYANQHQNVRVDDRGNRLGDLPEFVDPGYLAQVTRANLAGIASLAWAPAPPTNVRVDARELSNDTELAWDGVAGAAGYRVLWRATDAAQWQQAQDLGPEARQLRLRSLSRDNWVFAVQAIGANGHASLAVYAPPRGL